MPFLTWRRTAFDPLARALAPYQLMLEALLAIDPVLARELYRLREVAYPLRDRYLTDPDFAEVPLADLLALDYANARHTLVSERASLTLNPGYGRHGGTLTEEPHEKTARRRSPAMALRPGVYLNASTATRQFSAASPASKPRLAQYSL